MNNVNLLKLVNYSSSDSENELVMTPGRATPTPITFRGKRIYRRIIESGGSTVIRSKKKMISKREITGQETPMKNNLHEHKSRLKLNFDTPRTPTPRKQIDNTSLFGSSSSSSSGKKRSRERAQLDNKHRTPEKKRKQTPIKVFEGQDTPTPKKRWPKDESNRLKLALKAAINPTTDQHWDLICRSLGGKHTIEECKEQAIKLKWKPPISVSSQKKEDDGTDITTPSNSPWKRAVDQRKSRRSIECTNKFFKENVDDFDLTGLNLDDSLFTTAFNTPPQQAKCARRPFLIRVIAEEEENTSDEN